MSKNINQNLAFCGLYCPHCYRVKVSNAAKIFKHEMDAAADKGAKYFDEVSKYFSDDISVLISKECNLYCVLVVAQHVKSNCVAWIKNSMAAGNVVILNL